MEAILPDLNTQIIMHTREILMNLKSKNYTMCFGSLEILNGLVPEKYQVKVSTIEYKKFTESAVTVFCNSCGESADYNSVKIQKILLPLVTRTLKGVDHEKVWLCQKCKKSNSLAVTKIKRKVLEEPYFLQVVPKAPERREGIMDRSTYDKEIRHWILLFLAEISHQMGKYRQEYQPKGGEMTDDQIMVDDELTEFME